MHPRRCPLWPHDLLTELIPVLQWFLIHQWFHFLLLLVLIMFNVLWFHHVKYVWLLRLPIIIPLPKLCTALATLSTFHFFYYSSNIDVV
jgi:hypothetical protein